MGTLKVSSLKESSLGHFPEVPYCSLSLALSPQFHLYLYEDPQNREEVPQEVKEKVNSFFALGPTRGLLKLGLSNFKTPLPESFLFWQEFSSVFIGEMIKALKAQADSLSIPSPPFPLQDMEAFIGKAPFMRGGEYLTKETLKFLWEELRGALEREISSFKGDIEAYFASHNALWNKIGQVCFHLAENKKDPQKPFAFLATYTHKISRSSTLQHLPLSHALKEYEGELKKSHLLSLLLPVQKAADSNSFIKELVDQGKIFHPLAWSPFEAHQFLKATSDMEAAGIVVRVPNWWSPKRPPRPQIQASIGNAKSSLLGLNSLLDFKMNIVLPNGESLTPEELEDLIKSQNSFVQIKGNWVEVDQAKIEAVLNHWKKIESKTKKEGLSFVESLRLIAGISGGEEVSEFLDEEKGWSKALEGEALRETLEKLRDPLKEKDPEIEKILRSYLKAELRPYQHLGVKWIWNLYRLGLGGCLADDMGLGKTIQVLSLLVLLKYHPSLKEKSPSLLILPASLLGNWQSEIQKFAPNLKILVAHSSDTQQKNTLSQEPSNLKEVDLVITTYSYVMRLSWISDIPWNTIIVDEAQGIKNPLAKQTQSIKKLLSHVRFILTGTPIENRLLDLWSLFDFVAPGLLGSHKAFSRYGKKHIEENQGERHFYKSLRQLLSPYILRRLKTDKTIIADLPDKTEVMAHCSLTKDQVTFYQKTVQELATHLKQQGESQSIERKGLVLSSLLRLKQICNHPDQWLGHGEYLEEKSGKFMRLREIVETIAAKQEKVLVFTQFQEIIPALHSLLRKIYGTKGLTLHGKTPIKERVLLVKKFQEEDQFPFFVLSLKAGGTGLNLTRASHVIHFDRWWNPAIENQATDRAYRIGQKKNVLVHKFLIPGTLEEKIEELLCSKKQLANEILNVEEGANLTNLTNEELLKMITLDIHRIMTPN